MLRIYYVANNDMPGDGIPTLKVAELVAGGFTTTSLVQGVENLQLEYGLDTDGNGDADVYTASPTCTSHAPCHHADLRRPLDVGGVGQGVPPEPQRRPSPGHNDTNTYVLGIANPSTGMATRIQWVPAGAYKRKVFQEVVRLQNASGRRSHHHETASKGASP